MEFKIEEIKDYLRKYIGGNIIDVLDDLSEQSIVDCIPIKSLKYQTESNLLKYEMKIGMAKLKEEARGGGKNWMALSPKWIDERIKKNEKTKFEIRYWVNYGDDNTFGWFTVEQIKKWLTTPDLQLHTLGGTKER